MRRLQIALVVGLWGYAACGQESDFDSAVTSRALERSNEPLAPERRSGEELESVTLETGIEMVYVEQGSPQGIPVILVHGYSDSHHSFDLNRPLFPRRFHVFAIDQRGHGDSSKPACCYTQADFANDIPAFMDAVGLARASLVGHSMGSFVVQKVALDFPERVNRLVLIGSAPTIAGNPVALELKAAVDTLTDPVDPEFVIAFQSSTFFRPVPQEYLDTTVEQSLKMPADVWQQALDGLLAEDHSASLDRIEAPTLILFGDRDIFVTAAEQAIMDSEIPDSTLITYPDTGHGTHAERPRWVTRDIRRFLR
jgi:pimeloyl-ACP methyl ester carboxylesterase